MNFYLQNECTCSQPVATLAGVSNYENIDEFNLSFSTSGNKERIQSLAGDYVAGNLPKIGEIKSEIMGLAVFDGDKMIGMLDGQETRYYLMAIGNYKHSYMTIMDPLKKGKFVILNVSQNRLPIRRVEMVDGNPQISLKLNLEADILAIQSGINYEDINNVSILENTAEEFIKIEMTVFLNRTAEEFNSDIVGFGREMKSKFLTWEEWMGFNWLKKYKDSVFDVDVKLKIRRPGLIIRTVPGSSSEGKNMK
jgi:spore germination protein KC